MRSNMHFIGHVQNVFGDIPFIASDIFSLMCFAKDNFSFKYKPKCFVNDFLATGMLLKSSEG